MNDDMLNGVVMMILVTCVISTLMTDHAAKQIILEEKNYLKEESKLADDEKIFLCVKYPEIAPQLLEMAIMVRNRKLNRGLVALNVVYDDASADYNRQKGQQLLEQLQRQASASDVKIQTQVRLASNIANGIKHAFREFAASEIIMGMHVHTDVSPKFWGEFIQSLSTPCAAFRSSCPPGLSSSPDSTDGWNGWHAWRATWSAAYSSTDATSR